MLEADNGTSEMRYYPWGSTHFSSNPTGTPRRQYTGQMNDGDTGLYYYNARYYEPSLARFVQADTLVPDPKNPQSYNRYSYTNNNPVRYSDPTGHCPEPPEGLSSENVICVAGFIPTATSCAGPTVPFTDACTWEFHGDDRDFSSNSGRNESRFWLWLDAETGAILNPEGIPYVHPTCNMSGDCSPAHGAFMRGNSFSVHFDNGTIELTYQVMCSRDVCHLGPGPEGKITFAPYGDSYQTTVDADAFPNLEAYHWKDGELQNHWLLRVQNFSEAEREKGRGSFETGLSMDGSKILQGTFYPNHSYSGMPGKKIHKSAK